MKTPLPEARLTQTSLIDLKLVQGMLQTFPGICKSKCLAKDEIAAWTSTKDESLNLFAEEIPFTVEVTNQSHTLHELNYFIANRIQEWKQNKGLFGAKYLFMTYREPQVMHGQYVPGGAATGKIFLCTTISILNVVNIDHAQVADIH